MRATKTVEGATTDYVLDLAATLPVVISDTDALYLYGLGIIAEQLALRQGSGQAQRYHTTCTTGWGACDSFSTAQAR